MIIQSKLTRNEWESIEMPVEAEEREILEFVREGYKNDQIKRNKNQSMMERMKVEETEGMHKYLYGEYMIPRMREMMEEMRTRGIGRGVLEEYDRMNGERKVKLKKADEIRLMNKKRDVENRVDDEVMEYQMIEEMKKFVRNEGMWPKKKEGGVAYYTMIKMKESTIERMNPNVMKIMTRMVEEWKERMTRDYRSWVESAVECIEENEKLVEMKDRELYEHQRELYKRMRDGEKGKAQLIFYKAPTGTGKTMTPLGISEEYIILSKLERILALKLAFGIHYLDFI